MSDSSPWRIAGKSTSEERGFSLVEMIVAVGLFAVVMVICVSTLFTLVNANRKAQALQSVMNNLNITLDSMARSIRMGSIYHCDSGSGVIDGVADCPAGAARFVFEHHNGRLNDITDQWIYVFDSTGGICGKNRICKSENGGGKYYPVTAPEVIIESMKFYVVGTTANDTTQPRVLIVVRGSAASNNSRTKTTFHIQVAATQRLIDL